MLHTPEQKTPKRQTKERSNIFLWLAGNTAGCSGKELSGKEK